MRGTSEVEKNDEANKNDKSCKEQNKSKGPIAGKTNSAEDLYSELLLLAYHMTRS